MHELTLVEDIFPSVWLLGQDGEMLQGAPDEMLRPELLGRIFDCPPYSGPVLLKAKSSAQERIRV